MTIVLAHGGAAGALAESAFLAVPVVVFLILSRWAKRKERAIDDGEKERHQDGG